MKELILILSYCPTKEKKETLLELLKDVQRYRDNYSILLASHTPLDPLFMEYIDHYFFEQKNEVLTDIEYRQNSWFAPKENFVIWSSYTEIGNTLGPIWDMLVPSISIAKSFGYKKIHYFEYDTRIENTSELSENSELLNTFDYVIYGSESSHKLFGSFLSFNVDGIIDEWHLPSEKILPELFFGKYPKVPEDIIHDLIINQRTYIKKNHEDLFEKGIILGLKRGGKVYWDVPYFDPSNNSLNFVSFNCNDENYIITIIVDNEKIITLPSPPENNWILERISDNILNTKQIKIFRNDTKILDLDFSNFDFLQKFIEYNSVLDDTSLSPIV